MTIGIWIGTIATFIASLVLSFVMAKADDNWGGCVLGILIVILLIII